MILFPIYGSSIVLLALIMRNQIGISCLSILLENSESIFRLNSTSVRYVELQSNRTEHLKLKAMLLFFLKLQSMLPTEHFTLYHLYIPATVGFRTDLAAQ